MIKGAEHVRDAPAVPASERQMWLGHWTGMVYVQFYTDATQDASALGTSLISVCDEAGGSTPKAVSLLCDRLMIVDDVQ